MMVILLIVLLIFAVGGLPQLGGHSYGYGPSGIVGTLLVVLLILFLVGRF